MTRLLLSLVFVAAAVGCSAEAAPQDEGIAAADAGGKVDSPFDSEAEEAGGELEELVRALEASDADPLEFAHELGGRGGELGPMQLLPPVLKDDFETLHESIAEGGEAKEDSPDYARADGIAAVVVIANGSDRIWQRNLLEWSALAYFNLHMRWHYDSVAICIGEDAKWSCARSALSAADADSEIGGIDVILEVHGSRGHAFDNAHEAIAPDELLIDGAGKFRFGMFMNCYAATAGFPQTFIDYGGAAAYGAPELSNPLSDLTFQVYFGSRRFSFERAVSWGELNAVDAFDFVWHTHGGDEFFSDKQVYGPAPREGVVYIP